MRFHRKMNNIGKYEISLHESDQKNVQSESDQQEIEIGRRLSSQSKSQFQNIQETQRFHLKCLSGGQKNVQPHSFLLWGSSSGGRAIAF